MSMMEQISRSIDTGRGGHKEDVGDLPGMLEFSKQVANFGLWTSLRRQTTPSDGRPDPLLVMRSARTSEATDLRDKVYALLGLFDDDFAAKIVVDYSPHYIAAQAFRSFSAACIETGQGMLLLEHAAARACFYTAPS